MATLCSLFGEVCLLAAVISLVTPHLHMDPDTNRQAAPALQPAPSVAATGTYFVKGSTGRPCLKATMGLGYTVIIQKKSWYFSVDPSIVLVSGYCGDDAASLSLTLPNNSASLQLTYTLVNSVSYVTKLSAHISPQPVCNGCSSKTYQGELTNTSLFLAPYGQSYQCTSQSVIMVVEELRVRLDPLQIQAFRVPDGGYSQEVICQVDFKHIIVPTILWATAVGLVLAAVLTYLIVKDRRVIGYQSL